MPKKSVIKKLVLKKITTHNLFNRQKIIVNISKKSLNKFDFLKINFLFQKLKNNAHKTRNHLYCFHTGRTSGLSKLFGISRLSIRSLGFVGLLPGLSKASW